MSLSIWTHLLGALVLTVGTSSGPCELRNMKYSFKNMKMQSEEQQVFIEQHAAESGKNPPIYPITKSELRDDGLEINSQESCGKFLGEFSIKKEQSLEEEIKLEEEVLLEPLERKIDISFGGNDSGSVFPEFVPDLTPTIKEEEEEKKNLSNDGLKTNWGSVIKEEIEVKYHEISDNINEQLLFQGPCELRNIKYSFKIMKMQSEEQQGFTEQYTVESDKNPPIYPITKSELRDDGLEINSQEICGKFLGEFSIKKEQSLKEEVKVEEEVLLEPVERKIDISFGGNDSGSVFPEFVPDLTPTIKEEEEEKKNLSNDGLKTNWGSVVKEEIEVKYHEISDNINEQLLSETEVPLSNEFGLLESTSPKENENFSKEGVDSKQHKYKQCDKILDEMCHTQHHMVTCTGASYFECKNYNKIHSGERISEDSMNTAVKRSRKSECSDNERTLFYQKRLHIKTDEVSSPSTKCSKSFPEKNLVTKQATTCVKRFKCDICDTEFCNSWKLTQHKKTQCEKFSRYICNVKNTDSSDPSEHITTHKKQKLLSCNICNKKFNKSLKRTAHMRTHSGETPFSCRICNKKFFHSSRLTYHMRIHPIVKPFSCSICNKKFTSKYNITYHMMIHTGEKPFTCNICNKKFTKPSMLTYHMRTHSGERPFSCSVCNKKFNKSSTLTSHMRTHSGEKPFSCTICNKKFSQFSTLSIHMRTHTGEKPFSCSICSKKFSSKNSITYHMRTHTGEKPFSCSMCNKKFTQSSDLKTHRRSHTGEKPFSCSICNKQFTHSSSLRCHMKTHTREK